jgi:hypothetical protein
MECMMPTPACRFVSETRPAVTVEMILATEHALASLLNT